MARSPKLRKIANGKNTYFGAKIKGEVYYFGNVKTTMKAEAQRAFAEKLIEVADNGPQQKKRTKAVTVLELCDRYLEWCKSEHAASNRESKKSNIQRFCDWIVTNDTLPKLPGAGSPIGELRADAVTRAHVEAFVDYLRTCDTNRGEGVGYAPKSISHFVKTLKAAWSWAAGNQFHAGGLLPKSHRPLDDVRPPRLGPKDLTEADLMTPAEAESIIDAAYAASANSVYGDLAEVCYRTGARIGELLNACIRDYSPRRGAITLGKHKRAKSTTDATMRKIPLDSVARECIERQIEARRSEGRGEPTDRIFANGGAGAGISKGALSKQFEKWCGDGRHFTPYDFRHLWISDALLEGVAIHKVAAIAGTSVREITRTYGHFYDDDMAAAVEHVSNARKKRRKGEAA